MQRKILAIFFILIIFFISMGIFFSTIIGKLVKNDSNTATGWDGSIEYPLASVNESNSKYNILEKINNRILNVENKIEKKATTEMSFNKPFIYLKKTCDKIVGFNMTTSLNGGNNNYENNTDFVIDGDNGYLTFFINKNDVLENVNKLVNFGKEMESEGRNFLWFETPMKPMYNGNTISDKYLGVYKDYTEEKYVEIMSTYKESELKYISITDLISKMDIDAKELFFKTDHHWLPQTAIWASKVLAEGLNGEFNFNINVDLYDPDNYEITMYNNKFLGSLLKKVTEIYGSKENFPVIIPKYKTDLSVYIPSISDEVKNGSIEETLLNKDQIVNDELTYNFYGYGSRSLLSIHNNKVKDGKNVLIIKESFANCMFPYLAASIENLDIIDLRHFKGSIRDFINKKNPDTVIMIYGATSFSMNDEAKEAFDFR